MNLTLSIVVPAFNEAGSLPATLDEWLTFLKNSGINGEILVVDDGSTDATALTLKQISTDHSEVRVLTNQSNQGLGESLFKGLNEARNEWIIFVSADGQIPPSALQSLLGQSCDKDLVFGQLPHHLIWRSSLVRALASKLARTIIRVRSGVCVNLDGTFLIRRPWVTKLLPSIRPLRTLAGFQIAAAAIKANACIGYAPITVRKRQEGRSKVFTPLNLFLTLADLLRHRF